MINSQKSTEITTGIRKRFMDGTSNFTYTKCYGYTQSPSGDLLINEEEANVVRFIFDAYLSGASVGKISKILSAKNIPSPSGKETWGRNAIDKMLSNEKYTGKVLLQKTLRQNGKQYANEGYLTQVCIENNHQPIIPVDTFDAVQHEKLKRSNIIKTEDGTQRKTTQYRSPLGLNGPSF